MEVKLRALTEEELEAIKKSLKEERSNIFAVHEGSERIRYLLFAAFEYLQKLEKRGIGLDETVIYDDAECDFYCLKDDIGIALDIRED